ncbi:unnamed protein product [Calypogeia fissa]
MASPEPRDDGGGGGDVGNNGGGPWRIVGAAGQAEMDNSNNGNNNDITVQQEEVDLRSIEAENVGDDDALDADLEREFVLQQEAKRLWEEAEEDRRSVGFPPAATQTSTPATDANDEDVYDDHPLFLSTKFGEVPNWGYRVRVSRPNAGELLTLSPGPRVEEGGKVEGRREGKQGKQSKLLELLLEQKSFRRELDLDSGLELQRREPNQATGATTANGSPSAWNDTMLALFPTAGKLVASTMDKKTGRIANGGGGRGGLGHGDDDEIAELHEEIFQVTVPTTGVAWAGGADEERPSGSWLRLGLPSNSMKCSTPSGDNVRSISSFRRNAGSSSKMSVRTATSLERQYSTGSTSTVESPILLVQERKRSIGPWVTRGEPHTSAGGGGRLTFSFPGWDVDISKGEKYPSVVNHNHMDHSFEGGEFGRPPKRLKGDSGPHPSASTSSGGKAVEEDLGDRSPVWELPDEILLQIMRRLNVQDLCSSVQTCKRWYAVGLQNHLWEHFLGGVDRGMLSDSSSDCLPRWVCKKNVSLSEAIRLRFNVKAPVFSKAYDYLRLALHAWWNNGLLSTRYSSKRMYPLVRKMTVNDWSLLYEALGIAFIDRTDRMANALMRKLKPVAQTTGGTASEPNPVEKTDTTVDSGSLAVLYEKPKCSSIRSGSSSDFDVHWKSGSIKEVSEEEGVLGKELWESLLVSWQKYKGWLHLVSTHCPDLNHEVNIERARSPNQPATPTVYNKGLICFRSQVVLRYGLRSLLQAGFIYLTTQDGMDGTSDQDMDLLRASHHMLQELDVADDFTLPLKNHTQTKLRQCFRSALSTNSKLALHMNDRLNHL